MGDKDFGVANMRVIHGIQKMAKNSTAQKLALAGALGSCGARTN